MKKIAAIRNWIFKNVNGRFFHFSDVEEEIFRDVEEDKFSVV